MTYQKIPSLYKREPERPHNIMHGVYADPAVEYLKDNMWHWTEKIDGTNIRIIWDGHKVIFGGRSDNAQIPASLITVLNDTFKSEGMEELFEEVFGGIEAVLYGEGYGPKIQKGGGNYGDTVKFILFDVKAREWYLQHEDVLEVAEKFGIETVPLVLVGDINEAVEEIKHGFYSIIGEKNGNEFLAEGLVGRPAVQLFNRQGKRVIVKIKARDSSPQW